MMLDPVSQRVRGQLCICRWKIGLLSLYQSSHCVRDLTFPRLLFLTQVSSSTPETFDIVTSTVGVAARKNLAVISKMLTQIASGSLFGDDDPSFTPLNSYVEKGIQQMSVWFMQGAKHGD